MMNNLDLLSDFNKFLMKKKEKNQEVIAFISHDNIPEELFDAAGFFPLRMMFIDNEDIINASHDYLPPSTCAFAQSCIGLCYKVPSKYMFLDLVDHFLISNHCVSDICASEIISKYFNKNRLSFYISYTKNENSLKYFTLELKDLKKQIEKIIGVPVENEDLIKSIKKYNEFKKKLIELNDLEIKAKIKLELIQKAMLFGPDIIPELVDFITKHQQNTKDSNNKSKDILLTGCSIFINDYLIDLIEEAGGNIIFFDTWIGSNYFTQIFDDEILNNSNDPIELFNLRFKSNIYGDHSVPNFIENKVSQIEKYYINYKKEKGTELGIINHIIKFCDHMALMAPHLKKQLQEKRINVLNLERDFGKSTRGQLITRIEAFLEMI